MKTTIHQLKTAERPLEGMCYVIQCEDRSVLVVDGGMQCGDADKLIAYLKKITGLSKPVIDRWFITHNHADHTFCFLDAAENHADELTVNKMCVSFLSEEFYSACEPACVGELRRFLAAVGNLSGCRIVPPRSGEVYRYGGTRIEILYTAEDLPVVDGGKGNNLNDTSLVFRVRAEGQTVLFLGDVQDVGDAVMISKYGRDLKSDVVQVAHHGYPASTSEFYDLVDPEILLWPTTKRRFDFCMRAVKVDRRLIEEMRVKDIYFAFEGDAVLELPVLPRPDFVLPDTFVPLKSAAPVCEFVGVKRAPDISDPNDPLWNASPVFRAVHDLYPAPGPGEDSGTFRALWKDDRLFLNIRFNKKPVSDPSRFGSLDSDCVRLYFSEETVRDRMTLWADVREKPGYIDNIKFYAEEKNIKGKKLFCTDPGKCKSNVFADENGFTVCAALKLTRSHEKGDVIGFNLEFNGVREAGSDRAYSLSFADRDQDIIPALSPSSLAFVELI